jgi:hypothetical protein
MKTKIHLESKAWAILELSSNSVGMVYCVPLGLDVRPAKPFPGLCPPLPLRGGHSPGNHSFANFFSLDYDLIKKKLVDISNIY